MSSRIYKAPKRTKSAGNKRALIHYERQYRHEKIKSVMYQAAHLRRYGAELCFINCAMALSETAKHFNEMYGDNLTTKHALVVIHIKHICVCNDLELFSAADLVDSDFHLDKQLGYFTDNRHKLGRLLTDLALMKFINKVGRRYVPTTRVKMFCAIMNKYSKNYFGVDET